MIGNILPDHNLLVLLVHYAIIKTPVTIKIFNTMILIRNTNALLAENLVLSRVGNAHVAPNGNTVVYTGT